MFQIVLFWTIAAQETATMFYYYVYRICGTADIVVSDGGPQFAAHFMDQLCRLGGGKQKLSTSEYQE